MKLTIDTEARTVACEDADGTSQHPLYSREAFSELSKVWIQVGWALKHIYSFTWMGRPIIQLPEDMVRAQEVIYRVKPDVIIETGVAHGGSLIFYASLFKMMGNAGRVIGVDIEVRPHNRAAIEAHELSPSISLVEGSSIDPTIVERVRSMIKPGEKVLVLLDSNHTKAHVAAELEAYASMVTAGSYIVATDGLMQYLDNVPRGKPEWKDDNPTAAAREFAASHAEFELQEPPPFVFNEGEVREHITHWPGAWLMRRA
ncbi:MAG: cephalosporin hydroxylase family protein [Deltaproteobacteria bacterium]|nr:cephalosporin hydroxylase family protein [Deltaproteobacteria bacterium]